MPENGAGPVREKPLIHREALMRTLIWFLASIFLFGITTSFPSHSMERKKEGILYPEGDIQEIRIYGNYEPHDPQRLDNFKEMLIRNHYLKPGDVFEKKYAHFLDKGDEKFSEHLRFNYCYDKTPDGRKEPVINKNLRVRLYDGKGNVVAEDYLRVGKFDEKNNRYFTVSYIPYETKADYFLVARFQVVRLEGEKEVILRRRRFSVPSRAQLIHWSEPTSNPFGSRVKYHPQTKCHHSRFKIR